MRQNQEATEDTSHTLSECDAPESERGFLFHGTLARRKRSPSRLDAGPLSLLQSICCMLKVRGMTQDALTVLHLCATEINFFLPCLRACPCSPVNLKYRAATVPSRLCWSSAEKLPCGKYPIACAFQAYNLDRSCSALTNVH